jgi:NDP-sugar pyrophosphorylase family protein
MSHRTRVTGLPTVCILAGGLGTRLGERVEQTPKPLIEVAGKPFLWHQLRLLAAAGASQVVLCVGYLGEAIRQRIGAELFGLRIAYSFDSAELDGTLGAIRRARGMLGERFLVLYGDTYLRIDYKMAAAAWQARELPAMMSVLRNDGRWEVSNAHYADGLVLAYDKRTPSADMRWIDYGLGGLEQAALDLVPAETTDLCELYGELASDGLLCGFEASERFYEIGTPATLAETDAFLRSCLRDEARRGPAHPAAGRAKRISLSAERTQRTGRRSYAASPDPAPGEAAAGTPARATDPTAR